jgi:diguanylate cyclase (GGDEF)-like protein
MARARRGTPSALLMFDVDHFKAVNDTLGHAAGDEALVRLTKLLQEKLRTEDILARVGGDEFALLLEGTAMDQALTIAERVRSAVVGHPFGLDRGTQVSLSIGVAEIDGRDKVERLFSKADAAMYRAKEQGRNRVVLYQDGLNESRVPQ